MLKVIVNGCFGKMGRVLTKCIEQDPDLELVCGVSPSQNRKHLLTFSLLCLIFLKKVM